MSTFASYKRAPKLTAEDQMVTATFKEITEVVEKETDTTKGFFVIRIAQSLRFRLCAILIRRYKLCVSYVSQSISSLSVTQR